MWLRDLLPSSVPFNTARIMTFGYNSTLFDKTRTDRLQDWADDLLENVGSVREAPEEQARPMIFVCHSLGGIVGRQAMIRLHYLPEKFFGITLGKCGLLFLSTPHVGSQQADWSNFLVSVLEVTAGLKSRFIVDELRTLNPSSVDSIEAFRNMKKDKKVPPFICLCEGNKTKKGGKERMVGLNISRQTLWLKISRLSHKLLQAFLDKLLTRCLMLIIPGFASLKTSLVDTGWYSNG